MSDSVLQVGLGQPADEREAFAALEQIAGRRTLPIPAAILAEHVLALPGPWDWPVRRAALEAILRRLASARAQEIVVVKQPGRGSWGRYVVERADLGRPLPYDVRLFSIRPLRGSCDCADYVRGALGLCKHLLAVVGHNAKKPRDFAQLLATVVPAAQPGTVVWDAVAARPGPGDPLDAVGLVPAAPGTPAGARVPIALARLFRPGKTGIQPLKATHTANPAARLRLVRVLQQHARAAEPAVGAVLTEEVERLERILRLASAAPRIKTALGRAKRSLYAYQKEGVRRFLADGRLLLADDMGLGKTTQAIVAASALFGAGLVRRGLLVVPASLKPQWEREWQAVSDVPLRIVDGGAEQRRATYAGTQRGFLVTNYEQIVRDVDVITTWAPDLVVLDEAQRIKNWATKTAAAVKRLRPQFRLVLTGTPMENRLEELASIVEWVDDRALEPKWRLVPWHSAHADGSREVVGARNLELLRARLRPVLLRRIRAEVLSELPARQDTVIPVELTDEQREAHDDFSQPIAKLASVARRRALTQAEFLRLMSLLLCQRVIANGMAQFNFETVWPTLRQRTPSAKLLESLAAPKLLELRELIASLVLTQKRKVVIFSQWRRMLELAAWAVSDLLAPAGLRALFFTGNEGARRRTQNLVDFHDDPQAAVLFLTDAGGVGLNLQKAANACINLELPWNPAVLEQRIGRIHRLGQKRPIDVYNLISRASIEERIAGLVGDKRALFKGLFDGTTDQVKFEGSGALREILQRLTAEVAAAGDPTAAREDADLLDGDSPEPAEEAALAQLGDESPHEPGGTLPAAAALMGGVKATTTLPGEAPQPDESDVVRLLATVTVERAADGGISLKAPPDAASALVSLFEGMARLLRPPGP